MAYNRYALEAPTAAALALSLAPTGRWFSSQSMSGMDEIRWSFYADSAGWGNLVVLWLSFNL